MGPGNRHDEEPLGEHHEGGDTGPDAGLDAGPDADADDDHGASPHGPLPDPLDRVWLHPTELSTFGAAFAPQPPNRPAGRHRTSGWLVPVLAGAAGALLTVAALAVSGAFDRSASSEPSASTTRDTVTTHRTVAIATATDTLARLSPSVVSVVAYDAKGTRWGSGVCVRHGTQLLTSTDVVGTATTVQVVTADGVHHAARVVGRDRVTNLVLLDVQGDDDVPAAQLADHSPAPGSTVWLLGARAPGATAPWMSSGMAASDNAVVSARPGPTTGGLLETDAASSAAVSGGALIDASGSVAGIVLGHVNGSTNTYAVSIDVAVGVAQQIDENGVAQHGSLGVGGVDTKFGPMIVAMPHDGLAARAGVHVRDVVESIDGRTVATTGEMTALTQGLDPGRTVVMKVWRGKEALALRVRLGATAG